MARSAKSQVFKEKSRDFAVSAVPHGHSRSATKHTARLSDEMATLRDMGDQLRATDRLRMERLSQLAEKEELSNAEMQEAERLSNQLQGRYGALGIAVDGTAKSITLAADAQDRFNEAMKAQALHQVEAEIAELRKNISELERENESLTGFWTNAWNTVTFRMGKSADEIERNGERMTEAMRKTVRKRKSCLTLDIWILRMKVISSSCHWLCNGVSANDFRQ